MILIAHGDMHARSCLVNLCLQIEWGACRHATCFQPFLEICSPVGQYISTIKISTELQLGCFIGLEERAWVGSMQSRSCRADSVRVSKELVELQGDMGLDSGGGEHLYAGYQLTHSSHPCPPITLLASSPAPTCSTTPARGARAATCTIGPWGARLTGGERRWQ